MIDLKKMLTKILVELKANGLGNITTDHITKTGISVAASSYTDVALTRTVTGTFLGATVRVSGTSNAVDTINSVTASTLTVRLRNVSASALSGIQVDAWVLVKKTT